MANIKNGTVIDLIFKVMINTTQNLHPSHLLFQSVIDFERKLEENYDMEIGKN
jgi:hypothetical protein